MDNIELQRIKLLKRFSETLKNGVFQKHLKALYSVYINWKIILNIQFPKFLEFAMDDDIISTKNICHKIYRP